MPNRRRSIVPLLAVLAVAVAAPRDTLAALSCDVTFNTVGPQKFGALQWNTDYPDAPGDILGSFGDADCHSPFPENCNLQDYDDCFASNDVDPQRRLIQGRISLSGFNGAVSHCGMRARSTPVPSDFAIEVVDATDISANPVAFPAMNASLSCVPAPTVCGDGLVDINDGEECDPGPYAPGGCCSSSCTFEPDGTACGENTGESCGEPDKCDGLGACQATLEGADSETSCALSAEDIAGRKFGTATALADDYLVVGAPASPSGDAGVVHVFVRSEEGYVEVVQVAPIEVPFRSPAGERAFGTAVDADDDTIVIGSPEELLGQRHGVVRVYLRKGATWNLQATLLGPAGFCKRFGTDVAVSGDTLVVGAPDFGCAMIYERTGSTWSLAESLLGDVPRFGQAVDVSGDLVIVGAPGAASGTACVSEGAAVLYARDGGNWTQQGRVPEKGTVAAGACFGMTVGVDGLSAVVGAPNDSSSGNNAGAAYIVNRVDGKWKVTAQLAAFPAPEQNEHFGASIDMKPEVIMVGAPGVASYLFELTTDVEGAAANRAASKFGKWNGKRVFRRPADNSPKLSKFGFAVAVASTRAVIGAPGEGMQGPDDEGTVFPTDAPAFAGACGNSIVGSGETCDDGDNDWDAGELCNATCDLVGCGDPNDSGTVTALDALYTLRTAVALDGCDAAVCDINGNGSVTALDALLVLARAVGIDVALACPAP